jgi:hypothetical protein
MTNYSSHELDVMYWVIAVATILAQPHNFECRGTAFVSTRTFCCIVNCRIPRSAFLLCVCILERACFSYTPYAYTFHSTCAFGLMTGRYLRNL